MKTQRDHLAILTRKIPSSLACGFVLFLFVCLNMLGTSIVRGESEDSSSDIATQSSQTRLPSSVPPVLGCWFWTLDEFQPKGYEPVLDTLGQHSAFNILTTSLRVPDHEMTEPPVHDQIKAAAAYAQRYGIGLAVDLDVRMARREFQRQYPDELQEMLRLRTIDLADSGEVTLSIGSDTLGDHQTHSTTPYISTAGRLVRVYSYRRTAEGILSDTVLDVTDNCQIKEASAAKVTVAIPCEASTAGRQACVMVAFSHLTPDIFAPHLLSFQRDIFQQYADAGLVGTCKDEWGFPPCYDGCPAKNDFWFSRFRASDYTHQTKGRDLVRDCLLMCFGEKGKDAQRQLAINYFMKMSWRRNIEIETDYYKATKEIFGPNAYTGTHSTWYPYPGVNEFKKNALSWWASPRDFGQTDEDTPYCVRTALAKRCGSPLWYNMFYSDSTKPYETQLFSSAIAGGRINYHPLFPYNEITSTGLTRGWSFKMLLSSEQMRGDCRVRLLNFTTQTPLDCPVAVIFGHACAMNWAGPSYDDVGLGVTDAFWRAGHPADLIPSSEITRDALHLDEDGYVCYGKQRYTAIVLYHPQFESVETAAFLDRAAATGKTRLFRVGHWTCDFDGQPFDGDGKLSKSMITVDNNEECTSKVLEFLQEAGVCPQSQATANLRAWSSHDPTAMPPTQGHSRLIDGTRIVVSGDKKASGDPIQTTLDIDGHQVKIDAVGVASVCLNKDGSLEALAAGGLREFSIITGGKTTFDLKLPMPVDMAIWKNADGNWQGVLQGVEGSVPSPLAKLTDRWQRLGLPTPLSP